MKFCREGTAYLGRCSELGGPTPFPHPSPFNIQHHELPPAYLARCLRANDCWPPAFHRVYSASLADAHDVVINIEVGKLAIECGKMYEISCVHTSIVNTVGTWAWSC